MKRRNVLYGVCGGVAAALVLVCALSSSGKEAVRREVPVRFVKTHELRYFGETRIRTFPGEVRASDQVDLAFRVPGTLLELPVVRGQQVKRGDLIGVLDKRDYESSLAQARSELQSQEATLASMKTGRKEDVSALSAQLKAAKARHEEAKLSLNRYSSLLDSGAVSKADYDRIKSAHDVAREDVRVAEQNLAKSRAGSRAEDIDMQEARIAGLRAQVKAAEDALQDTELRAPFDGVIAEKFVDNFQAVQKDQKIVALQDLFALEVVVSIPAKVVLELDPSTTRNPGEIAEELSIRARFPALPDRDFSLCFKEATTRGNVQSQTYDVVFMLENPEDRVILPGMGLDVLIGMPCNGGGREGFPVATSMLEAGSGETQYVWKVERTDGRSTVRRTAVSLGGYVGDKAMVSGDLEEGDRIVAAGLSYLTEGDEVRLYVSPEERGKEQ